ncbi:12533_t:CDS:2, partial [Acaulospora colombiana]
RGVTTRQANGDLVHFHRTEIYGSKYSYVVKFDMTSLYELSRLNALRTSLRGNDDKTDTNDLEMEMPSHRDEESAAFFAPFYAIGWTLLSELSGEADLGYVRHEKTEGLNHLSLLDCPSLDEEQAGSSSFTSRTKDEDGRAVEVGVGSGPREEDDPPRRDEGMGKLARQYQLGALRDARMNVEDGIEMSRFSLGGRLHVFVLPNLLTALSLGDDH